VHLRLPRDGVAPGPPAPALIIRQLARQVDARLVWWCAALLSVDAFFIAVYAIYRIYNTTYLDGALSLGNAWRIDHDGSFAEWFGYLKLAFIIGCLLRIWRSRRQPIYLALTAMYAFALLDDAFQIHERGGLGLEDAFALQPAGGLRAQDFGEVLAWTMVGVPMLGLALGAFLRSSQVDRTVGILFLGAFAVLALFAVGTDLLHGVMSDRFHGADLLFTVIEDGGEQITLTITCGLAWLSGRARLCHYPGGRG
jgi:hypothetical protein